MDIGPSPPDAAKLPTRLNSTSLAVSHDIHHSSAAPIKFFTIGPSIASGNQTWNGEDSIRRLTYHHPAFYS